jgi:ribosomal-protein-alanine N-acetyltransferase
MEFEVIHTDRLLLRKLTPEVFSDIFKRCSDTEIKDLLGLTSDEELLVEKRKNEGGYVTHDRTILAFALVLTENGKTIGRCGYHNWYPKHSKAELGYMLYSEEHKRKGYMSEALGSILSYGFDVMKLNRVEACISPENLASLSLIGKYQFSQEGHLRKNYVIDDKIHDSVFFSLLREEYETTKKRGGAKREINAMSADYKFNAIPTFRILDYKTAIDFYVGILEFQIDWEHRFGPGEPVYMQISKNGMILHLSENKRFETKAAVFADTRKLNEFHRELQKKNPGARIPELLRTNWGTTQLEITDPFGNLLRFNENIVA